MIFAACVLSILVVRLFRRYHFVLQVFSHVDDFNVVFVDILFGTVFSTIRYTFRTFLGKSRRINVFHFFYINMLYLNNYKDNKKLFRYRKLKIIV